MGDPEKGVASLDAARARLDGLNVRVVWKADLRDAAGTHLHPKDVGGTILSGLVITPITLVASYYLAIGTFRFGLDPDNQSVPIITSAMDLAGVATVLFVMTSLGVLPNG